MSSKLEVYNKSGRRFIHVKVGTDDHPVTDDQQIEDAKEALKDMIEKTQKDFTWVFTKHTISLNAILFDQYT